MKEEDLGRGTKGGWFILFLYMYVFVREILVKGLG